MPALIPGLTAESQIAVSFRGYNITNAGKTRELLSHPGIGPRLNYWLEEADALVQKLFGKTCHLRQSILDQRPSDLSTYVEDLAMIVAVELAQWEHMLELLGEHRQKIKVVTGYSLGEVTATIVTELFEFAEALQPVLILGQEAAELAPNVCMGILFSRGPALDFEAIQLRCQEITAEGKGVIAISTYLSPNTVLLMGEHATIDRFKEQMADIVPKGTHLRKNPNQWPPLHTPIVLQKHLRDRAAVMLQTATCKNKLPTFPLLSCVTGAVSYNGKNSRRMMTDWVDHPQQLWKTVHYMLEQGIDLVIHLGPEPNIVPATLTRLAENVQDQLDQPSWRGYGLRTFSRWAAHRRWLANLLSRDAVLLRAPYITQVLLEDLLSAELASESI